MGVLKAWRWSRAVVKGLGALGTYFNRPGFDESWSNGGVDFSEPYRQSAYVMRAIKKVAGPIAAVSLQFSLDGRGGKQLFTDPGLMEFWKKPAIGLTYADLIELSVTWLKLKGEFFWLLDDSWLPAVMGRMPFPEAGRSAQGMSPMIVARPDRMREVLTDGQLTGWEFRDGSGRRHILAKEQVVHCKFPNPYNEWRGLAEYDAAMIAAESDYLAGLYGRNLMRNNGDRGPIIVGKDGPPDDAQLKQITEQLREKRELGLRGIFKPIFLGGNISVEDPKAQAIDAALLGQRTASQEEVFLAFGVPPSMAHKMESYSVGAASDWYVLICETCIPTSGKVMDCVEVVASRQTGRELSAWSNWAEHPVMVEVRKQGVDTLLKLTTVGMPVEKGNEFLQLGLPEFPGWEKGYLPFGVAEVGSEELTRPSESSRFSEQEGTEIEDEGVKAITEMRKVFLGRMESKGPPKGGTPTTQGEVFQKSRPRREVSQWEVQMAKRRPVERGYASRFTKELFKARAEVLRKLSNQSSVEKGVIGKAAAADFMFSLEEFANGLLVGFRKQSEIALQLAGRDVFEEIGREDDPWKVAPAEVQRFVAGRENKLKGTAEGIWEDVRAELQAGFDAGDTTEQIAERIRKQFNDMSRERAELIAQTETAAAYGSGRQAAMSDAGVRFKKWLTSGNPNVRAAHAAANGQVVGIEEAFEVGGEELMHPGDPSGSPGNVINCRCVSIALASGGQS